MHAQFNNKKQLQYGEKSSHAVIVIYKFDVSYQSCLSQSGMGVTGLKITCFLVGLSLMQFEPRIYL